MNGTDWTVLGVGLVFALILAAMWVWHWWKENKIESPKPLTRHDINIIAFDEARSRKLTLEQYVRDLENVIEDISVKSKSIEDPDQRQIWKNYEQELRKRQLRVIQEIQDREWVKVRGKTKDEILDEVYRRGRAWVY